MKPLCLRARRSPSRAKLLLALLPILVSGTSLIACAGGHKSASSTSQSSPQPTSAVGAPSEIATGSRSGRALRGDEDHDLIGDSDQDNNADNDHDPSADYKTNTEAGDYHDEDDGDLAVYGHTAGKADTRTITALVKRYYVAAAAGDGAAACSMIGSTLAETIPEDYGREPGPSYLRGGKTCQAVASLLFKHLHSQTTGAVQVTNVLVTGSHALALFGSRTMPASDIALKRERGVWKIDGLIGGPLP
jgi:hypothetical protein